MAESMNSMLFNPMLAGPDAYAQMLALQQRQQIAQMALQQGMEPINPARMAGNNAGSLVVPISPLEALSKAAQTYMGLKMQRDNLNSQVALTEKSMQGMQERAKEVLGPNATPAQVLGFMVNPEGYLSKAQPSGDTLANIENKNFWNQNLTADQKAQIALGWTQRQIDALKAQGELGNSAVNTQFNTGHSAPVPNIAGVVGTAPPAMSAPSAQVLPQVPMQARAPMAQGAPPAASSGMSNGTAAAMPSGAPAASQMPVGMPPPPIPQGMTGKSQQEYLKTVSDWRNKALDAANQQLSSLSQAGIQLNDLRNGLRTGKYTSSPAYGFMGESGGAIRNSLEPNTGLTFENQSKNILPQLLSQIRSAGATMRLAQPEINLLQGMSFSDSVPTPVNLNNIQEALQRVSAARNRALFAKYQLHQGASPEQMSVLPDSIVNKPPAKVMPDGTPVYPGVNGGYFDNPVEALYGPIESH